MGAVFLFVDTLSWAGSELPGGGACRDEVGMSCFFLTIIVLILVMHI